MLQFRIQTVRKVQALTDRTTAVIKKNVILLHMCIYIALPWENIYTGYYCNCCWILSLAWKSIIVYDFILMVIIESWKLANKFRKWETLLYYAWLKQLPAFAPYKKSYIIYSLLGVNYRNRLLFMVNDSLAYKITTKEIFTNYSLNSIILLQSYNIVIYVCRIFYNSLAA